MTANALREEALWALRRLGNKATAAVACGHGNNRGHWDDSAAARSLDPGRWILSAHR